MVWSNVHYLPIFSFMVLPSTFLVTYSISIMKGDVTLIPYISDTGTCHPAVPSGRALRRQR